MAVASAAKPLPGDGSSVRTLAVRNIPKSGRSGMMCSAMCISRLGKSCRRQRPDAPAGASALLTISGWRVLMVFVGAFRWRHGS